MTGLLAADHRDAAPAARRAVAVGDAGRAAAGPGEAVEVVGGAAGAVRAGAQVVRGRLAHGVAAAVLVAVADPQAVPLRLAGVADAGLARLVPQAGGAGAHGALARPAAGEEPLAVEGRPGQAGPGRAARGVVLAGAEAGRDGGGGPVAQVEAQLHARALAVAVEVGGAGTEADAGDAERAGALGVAEARLAAQLRPPGVGATQGDLPGAGAGDGADLALGAVGVGDARERPRQTGADHRTHRLCQLEGHALLAGIGAGVGVGLVAEAEAGALRGLGGEVHADEIGLAEAHAVAAGSSRRAAAVGRQADADRLEVRRWTEARQRAQLAAAAGAALPRVAGLLAAPLGGAFRQYAQLSVVAVGAGDAGGDVAAGAVGAGDAAGAIGGREALDAAMVAAAARGCRAVGVGETRDARPGGDVAAARAGAALARLVGVAGGAVAVEAGGGLGGTVGPGPARGAGAVDAERLGVAAVGVGLAGAGRGLARASAASTRGHE